jgi:tripartite-type tricarboxylate transporter receptor subunit TctC
MIARLFSRDFASASVISGSVVALPTEDQDMSEHNCRILSSRQRRCILKIAAVAGAMIGLDVAAVSAQPAFPSRPIEIIIGFPAGSVVDIVARTIGDRMQKSLGQPLMVKNMPGASGNLATEAAARAQADGHTIVLAGNASLVVNQHLFDKLSYNPIADLAPISQVAITPNILVVNANVPARSLAEFVSLSRAQPGTVTYGHVGVGTSQHLAAVFLSNLAGIELRPIPYRGGPAIYPDLIEGRIHACFCNIFTALPLIREGKLRALAVTSLRRAAAAPDIATLDELGFRGIDSSGWFGFLAPAGTPPAVIDRLHREIQSALSDDVQKTFENQGIITITGSSPSAFAATIKSESTYWEKVIKENGIKAQ